MLLLSLHELLSQLPFVASYYNYCRRSSYCCVLLWLLLLLLLCIALRDQKSLDQLKLAKIKNKKIVWPNKLALWLNKRTHD